MDSFRLVPELQPGDICAHDGLYQVIHQEHREPHKVIATKGIQFPSCRQCGSAVRFRLLMKVNEPARPRAKAARKRLG